MEKHKKNRSYFTTKWTKFQYLPNHEKRLTFLVSSQKSNEIDETCSFERVPSKLYTYIYIYIYGYIYFYAKFNGKTNFEIQKSITFAQLNLSHLQTGNKCCQTSQTLFSAAPDSHQQTASSWRLQYSIYSVEFAHANNILQSIIIDNHRTYLQICIIASSNKTKFIAATKSLYKFNASSNNFVRLVQFLTDEYLGSPIPWAKWQKTFGFSKTAHSSISYVLYKK